MLRYSCDYRNPITARHMGQPSPSRHRHSWKLRPADAPEFAIATHFLRQLWLERDSTLDCSPRCWEAIRTCSAEKASKIDVPPSVQGIGN
jgi:hypothetical protein